MGVEVSPEKTIELLRALVQIESVNPSLVKGGEGETQIATTINRILREAGIEAHLQEAAPGRPNVIGVLRGSGGGRTLILNAHTDTVGLEGMEEPLSARIEDGKLFGRGSFDTKGGLAAGLAAILALKASGIALRGNLVVVGAADEEYASVGTEALAREARADGCVILEPTGLGVCVAHGGFAWAEIETQGVAAHGSLPDTGLDAIAKMGPILVELAELAQRLQTENAFYSPLAQETMRPSLHTSLIEGGRELSTYPDRCKVSVERRMTPAETSKDFEGELARIVKRVTTRDPKTRATWNVTLAREPWQATPGPLLSALDKACAGMVGAAPHRGTTMGWLDSAIMQAAAIPCVVYGPGGEGAHARVEWVDVESVVTCARVLAQTAIEFCG